MKVSENDKVTALLYEKLPGGSDLDFNRIFDAVDVVQGSDPIMKSVKRFLYQYNDTARNRDLIRDRYDIVFSPLHSQGKQLMKRQRIWVWDRRSSSAICSITAMSIVNTRAISNPMHSMWRTACSYSKSARTIRTDGQVRS